MWLEGVVELLGALSFEVVIPRVESRCIGEFDVVRVSLLRCVAAWLSSSTLYYPFPLLRNVLIDANQWNPTCCDGPLNMPCLGEVKAGFDPVMGNSRGSCRSACVADRCRSNNFISQRLKADLDAAANLQKSYYSTIVDGVRIVTTTEYVVRNLIRNQNN